MHIPFPLRGSTVLPNQDPVRSPTRSAFHLTEVTSEALRAATRSEWEVSPDVPSLLQLLIVPFSPRLGGSHWIWVPATWGWGPETRRALLMNGRSFRVPAYLVLEIWELEIPRSPEKIILSTLLGYEQYRSWDPGAPGPPDPQTPAYVQVMFLSFSPFPPPACQSGVLRIPGPPDS